MKRDKIKHFSLRIDETALAKFRYVCTYDARSANGHLVNYIRTTVKDFEKEYGEIKDEDLSSIFIKRS